MNFSTEVTEIDEKTMDILREQTKNEETKRVVPLHASLYCPVPKGANPPPQVPKDAAAISMVGSHSEGRKVKIFRNQRNAMQAGTSFTEHWQLSMGRRSSWNNPLMGWASSGDALSNQVMKFDTKEDAVAFAEKQGWSVEVEDFIEPDHHWGEKQYAFNFLPEDKANALKKSKRFGVKEFRHPTGNASNWCRTPTFRGDGIVGQHGGEAGKTVWDKKN